MAFPDRIERTLTLNPRASEVWKALTTADGLARGSANGRQ